MALFYWNKHPDGPFVTLIRISTVYCHPEIADDDSYDALKVRSKRENDPEMQVFKQELREAIRDPNQLPGNELSRNVQYDDGSPEKFLRRLWHDLYGDEPVA